MNVGRYILFGLGQVGLMCLMRFFFMWILDFSTLEDKNDGTSTVLFLGSAVGGTLLIFRFLDGITDPVAGALSDNMVSKGKTRQQLLKYFFLLPAIGLILCFTPDHSMVTSLRWAFLVGGMVIFFIGYTFYAIPYWSLIDDYSQGNENQRRILSNILGAGILIATGIGFAVSPMLIDKYGYFKSAIYFAIPSFVLMILPFFAAPKKDHIPETIDETSYDPIPKSKTEGELEEEITANESTELPKWMTKLKGIPFVDKRFLATLILIWGLFAMFKESLKNKKFLAILFIFSGSNMSFTIMTSAAPFIAVNLLDGTKADVAKIMVPLLGLAIPFFIIVPYLSKKWGWQKAIVGSSIVLGVVYVACMFLGITIIKSPMLTAQIIFALAGPMIAVLLGIEGEAITACAKEQGGKSVSIYFGLYNMVVKAMNGLALLITGILIDMINVRGNLPVKLMPVIAGSCLFLGVIGYFIVMRGEKVKTDLQQEP